MDFNDSDRILITGATGLVGSHVAERARSLGLTTRALVRASADTTWLQEQGVELVTGDMSSPESLAQACDGVTRVVHCAARVGDWGPVDDYREVNVHGLENLLKASMRSGSLKRFVHISSLGVYPARDHHGTDETTAPSAEGIDGYTLTKVEAEQLALRYIKEEDVPGVVLRPGFIYGPRDRTVLPRLLEKIRTKQFKYLGSRDKLMNNTYVGNLVDAVFLALVDDSVVGEVFNIRDLRLVSKQEFIESVANAAGYPVPTGVVPLPIAKFLAKAMEGTWRLLRKKEAPLLSSARIKFLGLNLDYSIDKAIAKLGYQPQTDFTQAMQTTMDWFRDSDQIPSP